MINRLLSNNLLLLVILSAIWGSAFFAIKLSINYFHPVSVASLRLIIGAIFLFLFFSYKKYSFNFFKKNFFIIILIGFIGNFIPFFLISWSEQYIQSNTAAMLLSVAPIFTLLIAHFFTHDDKFSLRKMLAILIGLIGVTFIFGIDSIKDLFSRNYLLYLPKILCMLAALGYVISSIMAYNLKKIDILTLTTFVTISAAITSIPFMIYVEIISISKPTSISLISLFYLGLFPTAIAFLLRFYLISKAGPIFLSYVAYLIPGFAIIWGFIFLKEVITLNIFLGLCFVLIGTYIGKTINKKDI